MITKYYLNSNIKLKKNTLRLICEILLTLLPTLSIAAVVDTVIIADGTPGPYRLGKFFVDTSTIKITRVDSGYIPSFTYIREVNGILFSDPIDSGVKLNFHFETDYYGLPKVLSLFKKQYWDPTDTSLISKKELPKQDLSSLLTKENVIVSGYKSIGVSASTSGLLNIEQALDITIGGEIRPGTELKAHLNDQGSSLEGTTREISEFDMIYISLKDPLFNIVVGDQYIEWMQKGIIAGKKKIKGISAEFTPKNATFSAFGALAGGRFTVQTWKGTAGQGPYVFSGNGESGFITPVAGSIKISVNGKICEEGEDKDFTVDYDLGTFTFTPKILIKPEDLIRAEYEYKMFDYQKTITGSSINKSFLDSHLIVNGIIWTEIDNKNAPLELVLTERNIEILKSCGDLSLIHI
ncbi:MAG: hypothetical protein N2053_12285, partial [Chitinispirillaceae bacterium]|nr:hypothetical protein [Chitinispirillaceae bacterium]